MLIMRVLFFSGFSGGCSGRPSFAVVEDAKKKERSAPFFVRPRASGSVRKRSRAHVALSTGGRPRATSRWLRCNIHANGDRWDCQRRAVGLAASQRSPNGEQRAAGRCPRHIRTVPATR
jgi:hypothetical protein